MSKAIGLGVLDGVRVLDLGTMLAGPVACTLLSDFGADVVKVEHPEAGDTLRQIGPFVNGESLYWNVEARGKRSVTVDLHDPAGQTLVRRLAREADVVVENFRPGTLKKWNLSYEDLSADNRRLVMLSVSGYGQSGPYASKPAYDRNGLAFGGLMNITGFPDRPPVRPGTSVADYQSALFGAFAIMLALYHRDCRNGSGQHVDVSLFESVFRFTDVMVTAYDRLGVVRERRGNLHFAAAPGDHFKLQDGRYLIITASNNAIFQRLCRAMGCAELAADPRFATHDARWTNIEEINAIVAEWALSTPPEKLLALLEAHQVSYSPMFTIEDIAKDPHYEARGTIASVHNPRIGLLKMPAAYPRLLGTPAPPLRPAPTLGGDRDAVLFEWLGLQAGEIDELIGSGALGRATPQVAST